MRSGLNRRICVLYLIMLIVIVAFLPLTSVRAEQFFTREFEWSYKGSEWTWTLPIAKSLYYEYTQVSLFQRTGDGIGGYDFLITTQDQKMSGMAAKLHEAASEEGYDPYDEVSFILAFVQSLPDTSDSVTSGHDEYPRFPIETLVDGGGDCEDTSILFATIVLILDYDVVLIHLPGHLAVGVWGSDLGGYYFEDDGRKYYYCETTGDGWEIGEMPEAHRNAGAHLYPIDESNQYLPMYYTSEETSQQNGNGLSGPSDLAGLTILLLVGFVGALLVVGYALTRPKERPTPSVRPPTARYCPGCGHIVPEDAIYCTHCGKELR